jgi:hypothetical protein
VETFEPQRRKARKEKLKRHKTGDARRETQRGKAASKVEKNGDHELRPSFAGMHEKESNICGT